jgi:hypothetical protein
MLTGELELAENLVPFPYKIAPRPAAMSSNRTAWIRTSISAIAVCNHRISVVSVMFAR